jgi:hypothetical protein
LEARATDSMYSGLCVGSVRTHLLITNRYTSCETEYLTRQRWVCKTSLCSPSMARAHAHSSTVICKRLSVAAGFQVWNGMMVLLGLHLDGMRPTLRGTSAFTARGSCNSRNACCCYVIQPRVTCVNPARRKRLSGVVLRDVLPLRRWQLLAGGRVVTSDVWVTLRQSCFTAV